MLRAEKMFCMLKATWTSLSKDKDDINHTYITSRLGELENENETNKE